MCKKIVILILTVVIGLTLISCNKTTTPAAPTDKEKSTTSEKSTDDTSKTDNTSQPEKKPEILSGTLEIWSSGEELGRFVKGFNEIYPDITINITVVPNADFIAKLTPTLASGQGAPDIFTGESDYVKYLVEAGYWDDLRLEQYQAKTEDVWEYIVSVGTDAGGVLRALSWQSSPGSIMYRRDLALDALGTDDPQEVGAMLATNEEMLKVAEKLKAKDIKMFASWQDIFNMQFSNRKQPWVVDDKLIIDDSMLEFMDMAKIIMEKGYDLGVDPWAPEWIAAVESKDTFCYVLPSWGYQFVVKPGANTTKGKWAMCQGPVPYVKGGTWLGIYKDSPNKKLAWAFLEYCCLNAKVLQDYGAEYGEFVSVKSANHALAKGEGEEVLGGQNPFVFYNEQMNKLPADLMTGYDGTINGAFLSTTKDYATGVLDKDAAIAQFKEDVKNAYPDLTIE
ncbi:extracellular solute-binding protein [Clostridiales bacterium COT073_COT-073]|nr:extracellular solute-binding protein [Clostridiales bacterium COT073_COT-073]